MSKSILITAEEASQATSDAPLASEIILKNLYRKIKNASNNKELSISQLIPRGELKMYSSTIKNTLEENGYTVAIKEFEKVVPIMNHVGTILVGW